MGNSDRDKGKVGTRERMGGSMQGDKDGVRERESERE